MVAGFATATSDSDAQYSPVDASLAPVAPAYPYANTVTPESRPTGFSYSVQTYDTPKQVYSTVPAATNYVNPYALGGYRYGYNNQYALQQPYYNQGLLNAYTGYGTGAYNPYVAAPYAANAYATNAYAANAYGYAANPYTYAGYPYTTNAALSG